MDRSRSALGPTPLRKIPAWAVAVSLASCLFFIGIRHGWLGPHLTQQALGIQLDKWQLGPLRVINLFTFTIVFYWLRKYVLRFVSMEPFLTLGKASLRVFCAHLVFVFVGLALLYQDVGDDSGGPLEQLHGFTAIALLVVTFSVLILVATNEVRRARADRAKRSRQETEQILPTDASASSVEVPSRVEHRGADLPLQFAACQAADLPVTPTLKNTAP